MTYDTNPAVAPDSYQAEKDEHAHFLRELQDVACMLTAEGYHHSAATVRKAIARLK